jgi:hypothetical protein
MCVRHIAPAVILLFVLCGCSNPGSNTAGLATPVKQFTGCYAPGMTTSGDVQCGIVSSFGDPVVDSAFSQEVVIQSSFWRGIPANFHAWNDCQAPNAESLPTGDILFGVNFFQSLIAKNSGDSLPIAGVLAHEWAHQIQFDNGWMVQTEPTVRPTELEADAFSGFYMALAKSWDWAFISDYFSTLASLGDYNFTDPGHHGTPQERLAAAQLGFQTALQAIQTQTTLTYSDLHQIFSTAIQSFAVKKINAHNVESPIASEVLIRLDESEIFDILKGVSHGKNVSVPRVEDPSLLFPRR